MISFNSPLPTFSAIKNAKTQSQVRFGQDNPQKVVAAKLDNVRTAVGSDAFTPEVRTAVVNNAIEEIGTLTPKEEGDIRARFMPTAED